MSSNTRVIDMMLSDMLIKLPALWIIAFATFSMVFLLFLAETFATSVLTVIVLPANIPAMGFSDISYSCLERLSAVMTLSMLVFLVSIWSSCGLMIRASALMLQ